MSSDNVSNVIKIRSPLTGALMDSQMNEQTHVKGTEDKHGAALGQNTPRDTPRGDAHMRSTSDNIFVVPLEVFEALDPIERIVIRAQAERGEVRILDAEVRNDPRL